MPKPAILQSIEQRYGLSLTPFAGGDLAELMTYACQDQYDLDPAGREVLGLNLRSGQLPDSIFEYIGQMPRLEALNLSENQLTEAIFPANTTALRFLDLSENKQLRNIELPPVSERLEVLDLNECGLQTLRLPGYPALKKLDASRNALESATFSAGCRELEMLDLSQNKLRELRMPAGLAQLKYLYLNDNQLEWMEFQAPPRRLRVLHLRNNQFKALPDNLLSCTALETLYLHGNAWQGNLAPVVPGGEQDNAFVKIRDYLRELNKGQIVNDRVKIIIVGNGRVGKTSLFRRLKNLPFREDERLTHGVQLGELDKDNLPGVKTPKLQANVWDFGGQEIFYATHQFFLSDDALYILAWTAEQNVLPHRERDKDSLAGAEKWRPTGYWLENIRHHAKNSPLLMVQTHCDRHRTTINPREYADEPFRAECLDFCAADGDGLKGLQRLVTDRLNTQIPPFGEAFPETYDRVIGEVEKIRERNKITRADFDAICRQARITPGAEASVLDFLRVTGTVVWFEQVEALRDTVFINPNWLTEQVYRLINKDLEQTKGRLSEAWVQKMLPGFSQEERTQFLELLKNFGLIFEAGSEGPGVFIAPQYLPDVLEADAKSAYEIIFDDLAPAFVFRFPKFVPDNVMVNFLSRYGPFSRKMYWKNGICFSTADKAKCIVHFDEAGGSLRVFAQKDDPAGTRLQAEVCRAFVELSKNANAEISLDGKRFVSWQELFEAEKDGIKEIRAADKSPVAVRDYARFFGKEGMHQEEDMPAPPPVPVPASALRTVKIFLASSTELKEDRREFEIFISRENKHLVPKGIFLELVQWEDFLDAVSQTRLQDEYNQALRDCDIVVSLFFTKVGIYTAEEFDTALGQFRATGKPKIFTYFKNAPINTGNITDDIFTLLGFKKKLKELGHFFTAYETPGDLKHHFDEQLKKLGIE